MGLEERIHSLLDREVTQEEDIHSLVERLHKAITFSNQDGFRSFRPRNREIERLERTITKYFHNNPDANYSEKTREDADGLLKSTSQIVDEMKSIEGEIKRAIVRRDRPKVTICSDTYNRLRDQFSTNINRIIGLLRDNKIDIEATMLRLYEKNFGTVLEATKRKSHFSESLIKRIIRTVYDLSQDGGPTTQKKIAGRLKTKQDNVRKVLREWIKKQQENNIEIIVVSDTKPKKYSIYESYVKYFSVSGIFEQ